MSFLTILGTRPEAIKMYPVIKELESRKAKNKICISGQHNELLYSVLREFSINVDYNLGIYKDCKTLSETTVGILRGMRYVLLKERPNLVLIHGDTTTALSAALAAYYENFPIAHIEAGLRSYDTKNPFPEEFNRKAIDSISDLLFAPTPAAAENIVREGIDKSRIFLTGNTVFDVANILYNEEYQHGILKWKSTKKLVLLTTHRRENLSRLPSVYRAINKLTASENVRIVFPVHPNPKIRRLAKSMLGANENIAIINPLKTVDFHNILARCDLVITDSGGVQEEAAYYGKPTVILRYKTERQELIFGHCKAVGTEEESILKAARDILNNNSVCNTAQKNRLCRIGASKKIADILLNARELSKFDIFT